jgi:hypothetical protein
MSETSHSTIDWNDDYTELTIADGRVFIAKLKDLYTGLLKDATAKFDALTAGITTPLPPPSVLTDDRSIDKAEYSFMDAGKPWMQQARFKGIQKFVATPGWIVRNDELEGPVWNKLRMEKFMALAEDLLSLLMVLIHISNQPARASELFTLQIRNTSNVHRSFFATWGDVNWILGYSKVTIEFNIVFITCRSNLLLTRFPQSWELKG